MSELYELEAIGRSIKFNRVLDRNKLSGQNTFQLLMFCIFATTGSDSLITANSSINTELPQSHGDYA